MAIEIQSAIRTTPVLGEPSAHVPVLEPGDRLDRAEFERRYDAMPDLKKAELIEGVVHMSSPVRVDLHGDPHSILVGWLVYYRFATLGVRTADNASVRLGDRGMPQPDALVFIAPEKGGRVRISEDGYLEGPPELVAEVSSSTVSIDLNAKFAIYERSGVREYLVWRVEDGEIDWFVLTNGVYERLPMDGSGIYRSVVFPGLWLDSAALVAGDGPRLLSVLGEGLASAEHAAFKARLG